MRELKIAWMFPDTLYLHGERGNVLALERIAKGGGLDVKIDKIDFNFENFNPMEYDVLFFPAGEIVHFSEIAIKIKPIKELLKQFIESGKPLIATGTTVALFGRKIIRTDGSEIEGLSLIDSIYYENSTVYGDDILFKSIYNGKELELIGNQIQMGNVDVNGEKPFGFLLYGYGNNGKDRGEGIQVKNSIFTNALGPLLVWNPWLTREVISAAVMARGEEAPRFNCDDNLELKSMNVKKEFISKKDTNLTNCK